MAKTKPVAVPSKAARKSAKSASKPAAKPAKSRKTKSRLPANPSWQRFTWRHLVLKVRHKPNYLSPGWSHIELAVVSPADAPCPITTTGYKSHFLDQDQLKAAGGPVAFFVDWLNREARTAAWARIESRWRQLDLFA